MLALNTMRYSFNYTTMCKEKVNTHFSFPRRLDMSRYMEHTLLEPDKLKGEWNLFVHVKVGGFCSSCEIGRCSSSRKSMKNTIVFVMPIL